MIADALRERMAEELGDVAAQLLELQERAEEAPNVVQLLELVGDIDETAEQLAAAAEELAQLMDRTLQNLRRKHDR